MKYYLGLDIGGSHISIGAVDSDNPRKLNSIVSNPINSNASTKHILDFLVRLIGEYQEQNNIEKVDGIGISVPGPFKYNKGVSEIFNLSKYDNLFGLDLKLSLSNKLRTTCSIHASQIHFVNDAKAFLMGAVDNQGTMDGETLGLTIGTGFGSASINDGIVLKGENHTKKYLFDAPFKKGTAEDYFSARWFVNRYHELGGNGDVQNVEQLAEKSQADRNASSIFKEFGKNLAYFLKEKIELTEYDSVVIGGSIAKSHRLFDKHLASEMPSSPAIKYVSDTSSCAILGAIKNCITKINDSSQSLRKTAQYQLPVEKKDHESKGYDIYPTFTLSENKIEVGFGTLANWIANQKSVVIDGFIGVLWEKFTAELNEHLKEKGKSANWYCIDAALKNEDRIDELIEPFLGGEDPVFGHKFPGRLIDFFDSEKLEQIDIQESQSIDILYGCGAALAETNASVVYIDIPKNEIQYRSRSESIYNLGASNKEEPKNQYKRFYFVDWPVLNKHKKQLLDKVDVVVDGQRVDEITWMEGHAFRDSLGLISKNMLRARPWFEAGVWGGDWIKQNIKGLNKYVPNYAWSFELIVPENGIIFESSHKMLEVSFDYLLYNDNHAILGKSAHLFGDEFPIRFDFLDTFDGENLSLQCHPKEGYIYKHFGEKFTQDETYYMLDCGEAAEVYLGFQEGVDKDRFRSELEQSYQQKTPVDVQKYVQIFSASKHDLFLIPSGTIHCSGKNNLVLEISNTPYIFTFKMYDWLRLDLDGNPRPINIERAFDNLDFDRQGKKVAEELVSQPMTLEQGDDWKIENLPTHPEHFYSIHRVEFETDLEISTDGQCHVLSLVEGSSIKVKTQDREQKIRYAETFVIPAAAESYKVINEGNQPVKIIKAFVKDEEEICIKPFEN